MTENKRAAILDPASNQLIDEMKATMELNASALFRTPLSISILFPAGGEERLQHLINSNCERNCSYEIINLIT